MYKHERAKINTKDGNDIRFVDYINMAPTTMDKVAPAAVMYFHLSKFADTTFRKGRNLDVDAHLMCDRCMSRRRRAKGD
jgi:hypothetical protein